MLLWRPSRPNSAHLRQDKAQAAGQYTTQEEFDSYVAQIHQAVQNPAINDPVMFKAFNGELSKILGDGSPEAQAQAERLGTLLTTGGLNLMVSAVPRSSRTPCPSF